ncbi:MAG: hypothetical protein OXE94_08715 [Aestuariivita sp.]|nr:hypothetical protein [Aestuariivita sp.]MCY4202463.1 hypothetical protein [Aestuariivita sp.]
MNQIETDTNELELFHRRASETFARLLDDIQKKAGCHLVFQVNMGETQSYLTSVKLGWVAEKVRLFNDLPIFKKDEEDDSGVEFSSIDLEIRQQRMPDWTRQRDMAAYLASRRHHKFPALLLVGWQGWVHNERDEKWGEDKQAMSESLNLRGLDTTGMCWELDDSNTYFYALDGQHRLMAILGLRDLIRDGHLPARDKFGKYRSAGGLSREDIIQQTGEDKVDAHQRLQRLVDERIGIEIIPAIRMGESEEEGRRRLWQMFVDVNKHSKRLSNGELTQLDESNGYRVVARKLVANHPLLNSGMLPSGEERPKVELVKTQLSENADRYTTLDTMVEVVRAYLKENETLDEHKSYVFWDSLIAKGISIRPNDHVLNEGVKDMTKYLDLMARIPSHRAFIQGKIAGEIRSSDSGEDNILFRPMVQRALAAAVGKLATRGFSPEKVLETLAKKETEGQLRLTNDKGPWFGVLCDVNGKMRRYKKNRDLCCSLFGFLLGGGVEDDIDRERLREDFAEQRVIDPETGIAIDLEGNRITRDEIHLPNPWR